MHSMSHGLVGPHLVAETVHRTARFKPMPFGNLVCQHQPGAEGHP